MTPTPQPKALVLADYLNWGVTDHRTRQSSAAELRRQHAEIEALKAENDELRSLHERTVIEGGNLLGEDLRDEPRAKWLLLAISKCKAERDPLRAEVERLKQANHNQRLDICGLHEEVERLRADAEEDKPIIRNQDAPGDLSIGDYVFASRWGDCDPGDPWAVGHVSEIGDGFVVLGDVNQRHWRKAMRISHEQGRRICELYPGMGRQPLNYRAIAEVFGVDAAREAKG